MIWQVFGEPGVGTRVMKTAPVKRIGAVSPAVRETVRITPVRIP